MFGVVEIGRGEGTSDRHIDGKALVCPPKWKRYIPRSTSVNIAENVLLFHDGREHPFLRNSVHKISYAVVTMNAIGERERDRDRDRVEGERKRELLLLLMASSSNVPFATRLCDVLFLPVVSCYFS